MQVAAFTKSFQDWSIPEVCRRFRAIGLDGLDLTVRAGGHIEPENVAQRLPEAVNAAHEHDVRILMLSTDITDADDRAAAVLGTAGQLGIDRIKLGYYRYTGFGNLLAQLDEARRRLAEVARLARKHGVRPCVHVHSGNYISSHGTLLYELLRDSPPDEVGAYIDTLHMTLEGGKSGWEQGLDLLAPWIALVAIKNFAWRPGERDKHGQQRWETQVVPIADGAAPLPGYAARLRSIGFDGIYSLHSEYKGGHSFRELSTEECLEQTRADLDHFRRLFA